MILAPDLQRDVIGELCASKAIATNVWLVLMHVSGVLFESVAHRENLVWAMITGYKKK